VRRAPEPEHDPPDPRDAGVGFATAARQAAFGPTILVTGRNQQRGRGAAQALRNRSGSRAVHSVRADHAGVGGNRELAATLISRVLVLLGDGGGCRLFDAWRRFDQP
jgi:NAD(P)-dependent dehydrogenase (short-subunit alcohol dehydrogenase family)